MFNLFEIAGKTTIIGPQGLHDFKLKVLLNASDVIAAK